MSAAELTPVEPTPGDIQYLEDRIYEFNSAATGITDGELLKGVRYFGNGARTDSLVVRGQTGTVRQIIATHRLDKLEQLG